MRRLCKWFCAKRDWIAAERAIKKYRTALRANYATGISYRRARLAQNELYGGQRIGRGVAWS